eukprot:3340722-Amphidinium_carterae.2
MSCLGLEPNLRLRRPTPYPLGQQPSYIVPGDAKTTLKSTNPAILGRVCAVSAGVDPDRLSDFAACGFARRCFLSSS